MAFFDMGFCRSFIARCNLVSNYISESNSHFIITGPLIYFLSEKKKPHTHTTKQSHKQLLSVVLPDEGLYDA